MPSYARHRRPLMGALLRDKNGEPHLTVSITLRGEQAVLWWALANAEQDGPSTSGTAALARQAMQEHAERAIDDPDVGPRVRDLMAAREHYQARKAPEGPRLRLVR